MKFSSIFVDQTFLFDTVQDFLRQYIDNDHEDYLVAVFTAVCDRTVSSDSATSKTVENHIGTLQQGVSSLLMHLDDFLAASGSQFLVTTSPNFRY